MFVLFLTWSSPRDAGRNQLRRHPVVAGPVEIYSTPFKRFRKTGRRAPRARNLFSSIPRMLKSNSMIIRRGYTTNFTLTAGAATGAYLGFSPANLSSFAADFGSTFELCRVLRAEIQWVPAVNVVQAVNTQPLSLTPMYTAFTSTTTSAPTTSGQVLSYNTARTYPSWRPWRQSVIPTVAVAFNSGNQYNPSTMSWQSIGSNPQMNGMLIFVDSCGNAGATYIGAFVVTLTFAVSNSY